MNTVLTITGVLLVIIIIIGLIYDVNKSNKKFKKDIEELKVGNRYKLTEFRWADDNPFKVKHTYIVEIIDIKVNSKNKLYVKYKQIEPEYKDEPFSDSFDKFMDYYKLIK